METNAVDGRPISALEDHLGYWLRRVSNTVSGQFSRALQAKQTSAAEWVLLRVLHQATLATPGELAERIGMTRGAVSKIVDKLEEKGWLKAIPAKDDNRVRLLSLTHRGRSSLPLLARVADENDARFFHCLDADEKQVLRKLLVKLVDQHDIEEIPTA